MLTNHQVYVKSMYKLVYSYINLIYLEESTILLPPAFEFLLSVVKFEFSIGSTS